LQALLAIGSDPSSPFYGLAQFLDGSTNASVWDFFNSSWISTAVINGSLAGGPFNPQFILQTVAGFSYLFGSQGAAAAGSAAGDLAAPAAGAAADLAAPATAALSSAGLPGLGAAGTAEMGHATLVGALSVPPSWAPTASISPAETALPATGLSDIGSGGAGGPGGFAAPMAGTARRLRRAIPKYGFKPVVMPRPPAAG
jgi:PPE-repeat protein